MDDEPYQLREQIPLSYFFYGTAMIAVSIATFGLGSVVMGVGIVLFWACVFLRRGDSRYLMEAVGVMLVLFFFCGLMSVGSVTPRELSRRNQCSSQLGSISKAVYLYQISHGSFPPASIADADGRPMHSWRVLILPYIDEQQLYAQYRFDEPWDGPNNRALASQMPSLYRCPSNTHGPPGATNLTSYVAVVGAGTAWPLDRGQTLSEFTDGPANTLLVMETRRGAVHWMQPQDLTLKEAVADLSSANLADFGHVHEGFFYNTYSRNVAMADGSSRWVAPMSEATAAQLLGVDNGAPDAADWPKRRDGGHHQPNYGNWFRLAAFLVCLFLPLPWAWRRRQRQDAAAIRSQTA